MKFSITVAVACAALAAARPVNDNGKRQLDQLLSGLTGGAGGQQGANPLAGFLGGAGASAGDATGGNPLAGLLGGAGAGAAAAGDAPKSSASNSTAAATGGSGDLLEGLAAGGLPIPKKRDVVRRTQKREAEPQLEALTGLLGGAGGGGQGGQAAANPLSGLLAGAGGAAAGGNGDLLAGVTGALNGGAAGGAAGGAGGLAGLLPIKKS